MSDAMKPTSGVESLYSWMLRGTSIAAVAFALHGPAHAQVQDDTQVQEETEPEDEVVATGIRRSLQDARSIKRDADTFVDAISATDIGALPDRSVLEALQRVPGVSITRFQASDDPDHFSVEGSGAVIRGLTYTRSELNGRDTFTANNGRALGFQDVPPELVGGVNVFKNLTASHIEGGIAGTVDLRTSVPFDFSGQRMSLSLDGTYTDMREEFSPSISGQYSNRWDVGNGEFGFLANVAYSELASQADGVQLSNFQVRRADGSSINPNDAGQVSAAQAAGDNIVLPLGITIRRQNFDRERFGIASAAQWQSNDGRHIATAQFLRSEFTNTWNERAIENEGLDDQNHLNGFEVSNFGTSPLTGAPATWGANGPATASGFPDYIPVSGLVTSGVLTNSEQGWHGSFGTRNQTITRLSDTKNVTTDFGFNYKFAPSDDWRFNFDAQYVESDVINRDYSSFLAQYTQQTFDATNGRPTVDYGIDPRNQFAGLDMDDPGRYFWRAFMDHFEDSEGDEIAFQADAEHDFADGGWFESVKFGGRFAERDQTTRWSSYNWGNVSEAWNGGEVRPDTSLSQFVETVDLSDLGRGDVLTGATSFIFPTVDFLTDYDRLINETCAVATNAQICNRTEFEFDPAEIADINEKSLAAYIQVNFGMDNVDSLGGIDVEGNYGVRVVHDKIQSTGGFSFQPITGQAAAFLTDPTSSSFNPQAAAFFNGASSSNTFENENTYILPSLNVKLGLSDETIVRLAASRAIFRPDIGLLRGGITVTPQTRLINDPANPGVPIGATLLGANAVGGNPALEPIKANQFDVSLEHYFGDSNSFTATFFYKQLEDFLLTSSSTNSANAQGQAVTNNGVTLPLDLIGPVNGENGTIKGVELAYQHFFDGLPGLLSNLGVQTNYTYVDESAVPNSGLSAVRATGVAERPPAFSVNQLEGLSKHTVNLIGIYQDDSFEARVAYNWRSEYLLTSLDVISRLPIFHDETGQLDASLRYNITDNYQIGLQGVNLLSEETVTQAQIDPQGTLIPRSYFENDRRVSVFVRLNF